MDRMSEHEHVSDLEKLEVMLPHLLKHNREHVNEMAKWLDRAGQVGLQGVAEELRKVLGYAENINECLEAAVAKLESTTHKAGPEEERRE